MYITFTSAKKVNKAEPTLALNPRGDETDDRRSFENPIEMVQ